MEQHAPPVHRLHRFKLYFYLRPTCDGFTLQQLVVRPVPEVSTVFERSTDAMDFDRTSPEWTDHDYGTFRYGFGGESTVVTKILTNEAGLMQMIVFLSQ